MYRHYKFGIEINTHVGTKYRLTWVHFYFVRPIVRVAFGGPWKWWRPFIRFGDYEFD